MAVRIATEKVHIRVPATAVNLGSGFQTLALAVGIWDELSCTALARQAVRVNIVGKGANELPSDENHPTAKALQAGIMHVGAPMCGLELECHNQIPLSHGLGATTAAIMAGLLAARALISHPDLLDDDTLVQLAVGLGAHPARAWAILRGSAGIVWQTPQRMWKWQQLTVARPLELSVLVPKETLSADHAADLLPTHLSAAQVQSLISRASLLVQAMAGNDDLWMVGTDDSEIHRFFASAIPVTSQMLQALREAGWPACLTGWGTGILVFAAVDSVTSKILMERGWRVYFPAVSEGAQISGNCVPFS